MHKIKTLALVMFVASLSGCNSLEKQNDAIRQIEKDSSSELGTCRARIYNNNAYSEIVKHYPQENILAADPALTQDSKKPTVRERQLLADMRNDIIPCRRLFINRTSERFPRKTLAYIDEWLANDDVTLRLSKEQLSWGQAVAERQKIKAKTNSDLAAIDKVVDRSVDVPGLQEKVAQRSVPALTSW